MQDLFLAGFRLSSSLCYIIHVFVLVEALFSSVDRNKVSSLRRTSQSWLKRVFRIFLSTPSETLTFWIIFSLFNHHYHLPLLNHSRWNMTQIDSNEIENANNYVKYTTSSNDTKVWYIRQWHQTPNSLLLELSHLILSKLFGCRFSMSTIAFWGFQWEFFKRLMLICNLNDVMDANQIEIHSSNLLRLWVSLAKRWVKREKTGVACVDAHLK